MNTPAAPGKPSVLFVCVRNSGKSQMAAGIMRHTAAGTLNVFSAGTQPGTALNTQSVQALAEAGIDISAEAPKPVDPQLLQQMNVVVILGREAQLEPLDNVRVIYWNTVEPSKEGIEGMERMRLIRDDITTRVRHLFTELTAAQPASTTVHGLINLAV